MSKVRKIMFLLFVLGILSLNAVFPVMAEVAPFSSYGTLDSFTNENGTIHYKYTLNSGVNADAYVAIYDAAGSLASVRKNTPEGTVTLDNTKTYNIKVMLWEPNTEKPICKPATKNDVLSMSISGSSKTTLNMPVTYSAIFNNLGTAQDHTVTWSVSDTSKATIDATTGKLTPVALGSVRVIATSITYNISSSKTINIVDAQKLATDYSLSSNARSILSTSTSKGVGYFDDFGWLNNGRTDDNDKVMWTLAAASTMPADCYFDIVLESQATVEYLELWARQDLVGSQEPSKLRVDYLDQATHQWITVVNNYPASYDDGTIWNSWSTDPPHTCKIERVPLNLPTTTSVIRMYMLNANHAYDNFGLSELVAYGTSGGSANIDAKNLLNTENVTITNPNIPGVDFTNMKDGSFTSVVEPACAAGTITTTTTLATPYTIEFDFANQYRIDAMQLFTKLEQQNGIVQADFQYYDGSTWVTEETLNFTRYMFNRQTNNSALDYVNFKSAMTSNKFRLVVKQVKSLNSKFAINELALYGDKVN